MVSALAYIVSAVNTASRRSDIGALTQARRKEQFRLEAMDREAKEWEEKIAFEVRRRSRNHNPLPATRHDLIHPVIDPGASTRAGGYSGRKDIEKEAKETKEKGSLASQVLNSESHRQF